MSTIYRSIKKKEEFICSLGTQPDINRKNRFTHIKDVQIAKLESWVYKVYEIKSFIIDKLQVMIYIFIKS